MSDTFNFRRMGLLIRKHWLENRRRYLIGAAAYTGLLFTVYFITYTTTGLNYVDEWDDYRRELQFPIYAFCLFIGGIIYAGLMFTDYNRKESAVFNLLLPASALEKAIVMIFFGIILYWVMFNISFFVVDTTILLATGRLGQWRLFNPFINVKHDEFGMTGIHLGYIFVQTLFVLGNVYFHRFAFFKTAIVATALLIFFMSSVLKVDEDRGGPRNSDLVSVWKEDYNSGDRVQNYSTRTITTAGLSTFEKTIFCGVGVVTLLGLWTTIAMRIKEKEI